MRQEIEGLSLLCFDKDNGGAHCSSRQEWAQTSSVTKSSGGVRGAQTSAVTKGSGGVRGAQTSSVTKGSGGVRGHKQAP